MNRTILLLLARQSWKQAFHTRALYSILVVLLLVVGYAAYSGWKAYTQQNAMREHYQQVARASWEANPDKHPHRMAHFGTFAFRLKHPLSLFDVGLESFTGNAVFLEAHKQNTINSSEASFSTGLLRFGEISLAMLLQLLLPLVIVFAGFSTVSTDRENGTLKLLLTQGARRREILMGKSLGLFALAMLVVVPVFVVTVVLLFATDTPFHIDLVARLAVTVLAYGIFIAAVCMVTVAISAASTSSTAALMKLLGLWLLLAVVLPRTAQALGSYCFPAPAKVAFDAAMEEDVLKQGDSHNPDDPHYKHLRDSVLRVHGVDSVEHLPFNYSGFVMREGERLSAQIYQQHLQRLTRLYDKQNSLTTATALVNPFTAIRILSIALAGTDAASYQVFQGEAEAYRYALAQQMNALQMELISNRKPRPADKPLAIHHDHWKDVPDFKPQAVALGTSLHGAWFAAVALLLWGVASCWWLGRMTKTLKAL
jgi:ABC-2 type transport system permease protein